MPFGQAQGQLVKNRFFFIEKEKESRERSVVYI